MNCQGLSLGKREEMARSFGSEEIDIIGLAEMHIVEESRLAEGYLFLGRGSPRENETYDGVGVMVRQDAGWEVHESELNKRLSRQEIEGRVITFEIAKSRKVLYMTVVYMEVEKKNKTRNKRIIAELGHIGRTMEGKKWLVMGDFNAHVGLMDEVINENGALVLDWIVEKDLYLKSLEAEGKETWRQGQRKTVIDLIVVNNELMGCCSEMLVDVEGRFDIRTDHNVLMMELEWHQGMRREERKQECRYMWKRRNANWKQYGERVEERLSELEWDNGEQVNVLYDKWEKIILTVANEVIGRKRIKVNGKRKSKSWWTGDISKEINIRKEMNRELRKMRKRQERGENLEGAIEEKVGEYKKQKTKITSLIWEAKYRSEQGKIRAWREMEPGERERDCWKYMKEQLNGREVRHKATINSCGREIEDEKELAQVLEEYWSKIIFKRKEESGEQLQLAGGAQLILDEERIREDEVDWAMKRLKYNKAVDSDCMMNEFIKHGGRNMKGILLIMFNEMWLRGWVPERWSMSRASLLYKGGIKDKKKVESYRPIAVMSVVAKMLGSILARRISMWCESDGILGQEQSGFRKERSTVDNIYVLRELIEDSRSRKRVLYLAFLDIEKAFDRVSREGLWRRLQQEGMDNAMMGIIKKYYERNKVKFCWNGVETGWLDNNIGVRQGCPMSPVLFNIFIEELIARIRGLNIGIEVGERRLNCLGYADDLVILSSSAGEMQELLNVIKGYGDEWAVKFSGEKSKVMKYGEGESFKWMLGDVELEEVNEYKYLGMNFGTGRDIFEKHKRQKELGMRRMLGMLKAMGSSMANPFRMVRELWKGVSVPRSLYGYEICRVNKAEIGRMEVIQNSVARLALRAGPSVANVALRGEMGWSLYEDRISKMKAKYNGKLQNTSVESWAKTVRNEIGNSRWVREVRKIEREYDLRGILEETDWRKKLDQKVKEKSQQKWERGLRNKSSLEVYRKKTQPRVEDIYHGGKGCQLLFKSRTGSLGVRAKTVKWEKSGEKCICCELGEGETVEHLLLKCPLYGVERENAERDYVRLFGGSLWSRIVGGEDKGLSVILGFHSQENDIDSKRLSTVRITKRLLERVWQKREDRMAVSLPGRVRCEVLSESSAMV